MINRLFAFFALALFLPGCGYGVKTDDEGGFEMKMPGQSMKVDKEGIEIDQGVQKLRVGKDEVDIQQPGQRIRVAGGDVDIDQGVQKLHVGKDGVDIQQPHQRLQVSKEVVEVEQTPLTVDKSKTAEHESNPFVENGETERIEGDLKATEEVESKPVATVSDKPLVERNPSTSKAKPPKKTDDNTTHVRDLPPKAEKDELVPTHVPVRSPKEPNRTRRVSSEPTVPTAQVAAEQPALAKVVAAPVRVDVPRSPLRLRLTAPLDQKDFSGQRVVQLNLARRDLRGADFSNATIIQTDFGGCDLTGVNFQGAEITQCSFEDAKLHNANFEQVTMKQGWFSGANFSGANFRGAKLTQTDFRASDLSMATFAEAQERSVKKP